MVVDDQKLTRRTYPAFAEGYKLLECVGRGSEGSVWRALCIPIKKEVAVKIIELDDLKTEALEELRQQIQMMYSCSMHPHIVRYYTSFVCGQSLWCVMKYLSGGSCADIMQEAHSEGLDEAAIKIILKDTLKALEYFHANGRIHRDIKAGNIIISETGSVQVADFGVSGSVMEQLRTTLCGSPCWMAPEVMKRAWKASDSTGYDSAVDIWSLGITALELAKGRPPFSDCAPSRVFSIVVNQPPPALEDSTKDKRKFSNQFKDFVSLCLQKDPSKRPSASKLLKHKFFRGKKSRDYLVSTVLSKLAPVGERNRNRFDQIPTMPATRGHESNTGSWNFGDNEASDMIAAMNSFESAQFLGTSNGSASHLGQSFGADTLSEGSFSDSSFFDEWFAAPTPNNTMKQTDFMDEILENFGVMEPAQVHEFPYAPTPNNTMKQDDFNEEVFEDYGCVEPAEVSECPVAPTPNNTMKQDDFTDEVLEFAEVETAKLPKYSYAPTPNNTMKQDDFTEEVLEFAQEETEEEAAECPVAPTPCNTMKQDDFTDEVLEFAEVEPAKLPKFSHLAPTPNNTMKQDDFTEDVMLELGEVEIAQEHPHYQPQLATIVHQS